LETVVVDVGRAPYQKLIWRSNKTNTFLYLVLDVSLRHLDQLTHRFPKCSGRIPRAPPEKPRVSASYSFTY